MNQEPTITRPFCFKVIEDDGVNVIIEISEEDYLADLAAGCDEDETMKPGRYNFVRGGFLKRHPDFKPREKTSRLNAEGVRNTRPK